MKKTKLEDQKKEEESKSKAEISESISEGDEDETQKSKLFFITFLAKIETKEETKELGNKKKKEVEGSPTMKKGKLNLRIVKFVF